MRRRQPLDKRPKHHLSSQNHEARTIDGGRRAILGWRRPSAHRSTTKAEEPSTIQSPKVYKGEPKQGTDFIGFFPHWHHLELKIPVAGVLSDASCCDSQ